MVAKKEKKIDISSYVKKSEELIKMLKKLKEDKKLYFHIYDSLKGFDLIMSVIGKEKLLEYFTIYMKDDENKQKNYSKFVSFLGENKGKEFFSDLRGVYNGILENYDKIKFSGESYHFGSEEIYLRETLEKIKSVLESLGELEGKGKFINLNLSFLNLANSNLDFNFSDSDLEEIEFYMKLEELEEETSEENLLPFFHLLNNLMEELKLTQKRVNEMSEDLKKEINKNISELYKQEEDKEKEFIEKAKKEINLYLKNKEINLLENMISEIQNKLDNLDKNKNLIQSIIKKDIQTLELSLVNLESAM